MSLGLAVMVPSMTILMATKMLLNMDLTLAKINTMRTPR